MAGVQLCTNSPKQMQPLILAVHCIRKNPYGLFARITKALLTGSLNLENLLLFICITLIFV